MQSDGTYNYTYDAEGNLVQKTEIATGKTWIYTWDQRNRLTHVTIQDADGTVVTEVDYVYDIFNRLIGRREDPDGQGPAPLEETWTLYDTPDTAQEIAEAIYEPGTLVSNPWADVQYGSLTSRYLYTRAVDEVFARLADDQGQLDLSWYIADRLGSIRQQVDTDGTILNEITYDSFGNVVSETNPAAGDRFKFTGREYDDLTGLYYCRARWYDAQTGKFISEDSLGLAAGDYNLNRYVNNSPTNLIDPSGLVLQFLKDTWYYFTHPSRMDTDLKVGYCAAVGTSAAAIAAAGGIVAAGAVGGATVTAGGVTLAQGGSMTLAGQMLLEAGIAGAMLPVDAYFGGQEFSFLNLGRNWLSGGFGGAVGHWLGAARLGWVAEDMIAGFAGGVFDGLLWGENPLTSGLYGMGYQLLFGGLIRYGGRWIPASWIAGAPEGAVPPPMDPEMAFGLPPGSMSRNAPDIPQCKGINNAAEGIVENQNHLFGHNEYIVRDRHKVEKVKQGLIDFYRKHAKDAEIEYVDNLTIGGQKRTATIDTETGLIQLDSSLLDPKWRHLHDGYLLEELHHFHQIYTRGWLGRPLTEAEHELMENEVVRRLLKSGLEIFDTR